MDDECMENESRILFIFFIISFIWTLDEHDAMYHHGYDHANNIDFMLMVWCIEIQNA